MLKQAIANLKNEFVIVPVDKANYFAIICQKLYCDIKPQIWGICFKVFELL